MKRIQGLTAVCNKGDWTDSKILAMDFFWELIVNPGPGPGPLRSILTYPVDMYSCIIIQHIMLSKIILNTYLELIRA